MNLIKRYTTLLFTKITQKIPHFYIFFKILILGAKNAQKRLKIGIFERFYGKKSPFLSFSGK